VAACACCRVGLGKLTLTAPGRGSFLSILVADLYCRGLRCAVHAFWSVEAWRVLFAYLCLRVPEGLAYVLHICTGQL
jgi:hypothetical protein